MKYCTYIFKKGKLKGAICKELCGENTFCKKHINNVSSNQSTKIKEEDKLPKIIHVNKIVNKKLLEDNIPEDIDLSNNNYEPTKEELANSKKNKCTL